MKKFFYLLLVGGQLLSVGILLRYDLFESTFRGKVTKRVDSRAHWISQGLVHREHRRLLYVQTAPRRILAFKVNEKLYHNAPLGTTVQLQLTMPASPRQRWVNKLAAYWLYGSLALTFGLTLFPHD